MKRLIDLHVQVFNYLKKESKHKRTLANWTLLYLDTFRQYCIAIVQEYSLIFNVEYHKQKKQYKKVLALKTDLQRAIKLLEYIDTKMEKMGMNRQRRRQFWRDFVSSGQIRKDIFEDMIKEIERG